MPRSPRENWPFPREFQDPWNENFEAMVAAMDASVFTTREDKSLILFAGGLFTFDPGTGALSWDAPLQAIAVTTGFRWLIPNSLGGGSATLQDGELLFFTLVRAPLAPQNIALQVGSYITPSDDAVVLGVRSGNTVVFRNGVVLTSVPQYVFAGGGVSPALSTLLHDPCQVAALEDVNVAAPPGSLDGIPLSDGDRVMLPYQTLPEENGPWVLSSGVLARPADYDQNGEAVTGCRFPIRQGEFAGKDFRQITLSPVVIGTSPLEFKADGGPDFILKWTYIAGSGEQLVLHVDLSGNERVRITLRGKAHTGVTKYMEWRLEPSVWDRRLAAAAVELDRTESLVIDDALWNPRLLGDATGVQILFTPDAAVNTEAIFRVYLERETLV